MTFTIQPILITRDLDRLLAFYVELLGAVETRRVPEEGAAFYIGLEVDGAGLGLVADPAIDTDGPQRILLSIGVPDVDALLLRVEELGGQAPEPPNDMPWGQRVAHVRDPDGNAVNLTQTISAGTS